MPLEEAWYELPPNPKARARALGPSYRSYCVTPRAASPTQDTPVREGAQIQVPGGQDRCRALFGPRCPAPEAFPRGTLPRSTSVPGGVGRVQPSAEVATAGLSFRSPGRPASSSRPFGPITIRWTSQPESRSRGLPRLCQKGAFLAGFTSPTT